MSKAEKQPKSHSQITETQQLAKNACRWAQYMTSEQISQGVRDINNQIISPAQKIQDSQKIDGR